MGPSSAEHDAADGDDGQPEVEAAEAEHRLARPGWPAVAMAQNSNDVQPTNCTTLMTDAP